MEKAFFDCAMQSDLFAGRGGGPKFDRATQKRVARFEREGSEIPEWLVWMPLAIQYAQVPWPDKSTWARAHIPMNSDVRHDQEMAEIHMRQYHLSDDEMILIEGFRLLSADDRKAVIAALISED